MGIVLGFALTKIISMYADWLDDKVKKRFGGKRIADLLEEIRKEDNSRRRTIGFHPTE